MGIGMVIKSSRFGYDHERLNPLSVNEMIHNVRPHIRGSQIHLEKCVIVPHR
jgi:hypothetical protein